MKSLYFGTKGVVLKCDARAIDTKILTGTPIGITECCLYCADDVGDPGSVGLFFDLGPVCMYGLYVCSVSAYVWLYT
jgi:hypothetical protein